MVRYWTNGLVDMLSPTIENIYIYKMEFAYKHCGLHYIERTWCMNGTQSERIYGNWDY